MSILFCKLTDQSVADLLALAKFLPILMPSVVSTPRNLAKLRVAAAAHAKCSFFQTRLYNVSCIWIGWLVLWQYLPKRLRWLLLLDYFELS